jgi:Spy/CpxP family protein refolding chaperone
MKKKTLYISLIAVPIIGLLTLTGCRHPGHQKGVLFMMDYLTEVMDLTDVQQQQLDEIQDELMAKAEDMRAEHKNMHATFVAQLKNESINKEQLKADIAEHRVQMDDFIDLAIERLAEFHQTLTPEQKDKLVNKIEKFHKWHRPHWG